MRIKNTYFQFKSFRVDQGQTAMKVSTDACIFGARSACEAGQLRDQRVLDVGTGTGLLSLIWAQVHDHIRIDALETDESACCDCRVNFANSKAADRLSLYNTSLQEFRSDVPYDIIISNPPFFIHSLKSDSLSRSMARHADETLTAQELFFHACRLTHSDSVFFTLYPSDHAGVLYPIAREHGFMPSHQINIRSFPGSLPHCAIFIWKKRDGPHIQEDFIIYAEKGIYTRDMKELLKDFYLDF